VKLVAAVLSVASVATLLDTEQYNSIISVLRYLGLA
jgi:hypothetical protein